MGPLERSTLHPRGFNEGAALPYGLRVAEINAALNDVYNFFYDVNRYLIEKGWDRLEETLLAASFSGMLSEMVVQGISKRSAAVIKNQRHNGRPDLVPPGHYDADAVLRGDHGIEVKASRFSAGWQGHNVESGWILIVQFNAASERPTVIDRVRAATLDEDDWSFSGRSATSRRPPTAGINRSGVRKLEANPVYSDPNYRARLAPRTRAIATESEQALE
jgi:hypothetical protein